MGTVKIGHISSYCTKTLCEGTVRWSSPSPDAMRLRGALDGRLGKREAGALVCWLFGGAARVVSSSSSESMEIS